MILQRFILCSLLFLLPTFVDAKIVYLTVPRGAGPAYMYVMDDDGRNSKSLTNYSWPSWPVWSPDGKQIAFSKGLPPGPTGRQRKAIVIINTDGSNEHRLTDDHEDNLNGNRVYETNCDWSPDGQHMVFKSARSGRSEIWTINLKTKNLRQLTDTDGLSTFPSWSPDGKYIAYRDDPPRGFSTIYVMLSNGNRQRELAPGDSELRRNFPRWSLDSQSVVYTEETFRLVGGQYRNVLDKVVIHNINTDKRQIVDTPDNWSIHSACYMGSNLLLISAKSKDGNPDKFEFYQFNLVTGKIVRLTDTPADEFIMDWISDDVLPVLPKGKKKVTWGTVKQ